MSSSSYSGSLFPKKGQKQRPPNDFVAAEDAQWLAENAVTRVEMRSARAGTSSTAPPPTSPP